MQSPSVDALKSLRAGGNCALGEVVKVSGATAE
jgi:hypothetical protein